MLDFDLACFYSMWCGHIHFCLLFLILSLLRCQQHLHVSGSVRAHGKYFLWNYTFSRALLNMKHASLSPCLKPTFVVNYLYVLFWISTTGCLTHSHLTQLYQFFWNSHFVDDWYNFPLVSDFKVHKDVVDVNSKLDAFFKNWSEYIHMVCCW